MSILERILQESFESKQNGEPFLAVFDLDSTLFDLTLRVSAIVEDFRLNPAHHASYPNECEVLREIRILQTDWGLEAPLKRVGLNTNTPFYKVLHEHWAAKFFGNDFLLHDEPLPGAVSYVQELYQAGAEIMYLTGRDEPRMGEGTSESLKSHDFPLAPPTARLVLKPDMKMDDALFKLEVLRAEQEKYARVWLFENEPVNLNLIARECPLIGLVFIESTHSGREELAMKLETIPHFENRVRRAQFD